MDNAGALLNGHDRVPPIGASFGVRLTPLSVGTASTHDRSRLCALMIFSIPARYKRLKKHNPKNPLP
jgi:hypothetical protein